MAFSLNELRLIGNLGRDAESRFTTNNTRVTSFSLATTRSYKGKDGNYVDSTTWHNCVAYALSDYYVEQLKQGKKFFVGGRIETRNYTDKEGVKRYVTECIVEKLIPLDSNGNGHSTQSTTKEQENIPASVAEENDDLPF